MAAEIIPASLALLLPVFLVFVHKYFRYKEKLLELQGRATPPLLTSGQAAADKRIGELEERVQNLESIIVAMDGELRALPESAPAEELRRLRARTESPALLPAAAPELQKKTP